MENTRELVKRWLAGETTLAEEAALRDFFADAQKELPEDLQPYRPLFGQSTQAAGERSHRKLLLHIDSSPALTKRKAVETRPLRRWIAGGAGVAAASIIAVVVFFAAPEPSSQDDVVCTVNGVKVTDPDEVDAYTREALALLGDNLRKPTEAVSSTLDGDGALARAARVLDALDMDTSVIDSAGGSGIRHFALNE